MSDLHKNLKSEKLTNHYLLRLWPGIIIVILQWIVRFVIPKVVPGAFGFGVLGGVVGGLAIILWWLFFSRVNWVDRLGAVFFMIITLIGISQVIDESILTAGQGMFFPIYAIPVLCMAFVVWAVVSRRFNLLLRRITMIVTIILACGIWIFLRIDGITGDEGAEFSWRWAETSEEMLLSQSDSENFVNPSMFSDLDYEYNWPGFRGADRNGITYCKQIKTDWNSYPPVELWRKPIGPGCSSFSVNGSLIYTQEQRGEYEIVSCYNLNSGDPVWKHQDSARFWDSHAGAGPRSTPTIKGDRIYTFGATGILNVLDAEKGTLVWSRNVAKDIGSEVPAWGFTSSPIVVGDLVIVAVEGVLVAYDIDSGNQYWKGSDGGKSYSSPHLLTIDGVKQIILMSESGTKSLNADDGKLLWEYKWLPGVRIVQPGFYSNGNLLIAAGEKKGISAITVENGSDGWEIEENWTSNRMRPDFNDFVIHKGFAYGFEGPGLVCIDVENGTRLWKGGRYGGQLILLANQDLILVLSEKGEIVLVEAKSDKLTELSNFSAVEGKTWNHPVLVGDILIVRNTREMVAFRLH